MDVSGWKSEVEDITADYAKFGNRLPKPLNEQLDALRKRLG